MIRITQFTLILVVFLGFIGCGEDSLDDSNYGSDGPSTDKLTLTQVGNDFKISWEKKTYAYSQVTYNERKVIGHNLTGLYSFYCKPSGKDEKSINYSCTGEGPSIFGDKDAYSASFHFENNKEYKFRVIYGYSLTEGEIDAILEYSGDTLSIQ